MLLYLHAAVCWLLRIRLLIEPNSHGCSGHGSMDPCGLCICDRNYFGNKCECYYSETLGWGPQNTSAAIAQCTPDESPTSGICSGRGECVCGICRCFSTTEMQPDRRYSGQYCQCDDYSCPYENEMICGGHGRCICGKCVCDSGLTGEACGCRTSQHTCVSSDGQICHGKGNCVCGECECEPMFKGPTCEDCPPIVEQSSPLCNNHGSLDSCEQCFCEEGYHGQFCECHDGSLNQCIRPNSSTICSARGECICGMCSCYSRRAHSAQKYSGRYCQCDDYACSYHMDRLCGGNGVCDCEDCICDDGYKGVACECPTSRETCMSENGEICNGQGECVCGRCKCNPDSFYRGRLCEECPTCPGKCVTNKECILCRAFHTGTYTQEECLQKCPKVEIVDVLDLEEILNDDNINLCRFVADDGFEFLFTYTYTENNKVRLTAQGTVYH